MIPEKIPAQKTYPGEAQCPARPFTCLVFIVLVSFLSFCSRKAPTPAVQPQAPVKDTLVIAFYNVENFFDLWYDGDEYPEFRPGALGWDKQMWEIKANNIASVVAAMKADVVGLCEVENRNALKGLQEELKKRGADYPYSAIADAPFPTITAPCLLSKAPIRSTNRFGGGANEPHAKRNILEADIDAGSGVIKVFVNHWPSKAHRESQRLAVAQVLADRIRALKPGTEYLILGDLNSSYDELYRFHTERQDDTRGKTGLNHVLKTVRLNRGACEFVTESAVAAIDSFYHFDLWLDVPEKRRASHFFEGQREAIDHILLPHALFDSAGWSYVPGSFSAFTWDGRLLNKYGEPFRWQMRGWGKRRFHAGEGYSDHLPVMARLVRCPFSMPAASQGSVAAGPRNSTRPVKDEGFEASAQGWVGCCRGIEVGRDSAAAAQGRFSLKFAGGPPLKNECAGRVVVDLNPANRGRSVTVSFDIRGSGKLSVRMKAGAGKWRFYNGETFAQSGSPRYQPVRIRQWRRVSLDFTSDNPSARDLEVEFRAGKDAPFCFYLDNFIVR